MVDTSLSWPSSYGFLLARKLSLSELNEDIVEKMLNPAERESYIESSVTRLEEPEWVRTLRLFERQTKQPVQDVAFLATRILPSCLSRGRRYESLYSTVH